MKRYTFLGALVLGLLASAKTLSPEQALLRASDAPGAFRATAIQDLKLVYTAQYDKAPCAYVFQSPERGFVVTAADDIAPAVLGYSDHGEFAVNDDIRYWLEEYGRQINWANSHSAQPLRIDDTDRQPIAPWLTSKWNQSAPYNLECPTYNGEQCVTGCVATAMAQIMYFHKWPETGEGSNSYLSKTINQNISFDFGATTFDWANMLDTYPNSGNDATAAQRTAVATLMKACGVSCEMDYTPNASGAQSYKAGMGLVNYLKYDRSVEYYERQYFSPSQWDEMIYERVAAGPIYYSGANNSGGHAFVVDGYSSNGYFHLNWGWGGVSDGYFLLSALDPSMQGIGGSNAGYNFGQEILCNLKPAGDTPSEFAYQVVTGENDFTISTTSCKLGELVRIATPAYNNSLGTLSEMGIGLLFTSSNGEDQFVQGVMAQNVDPFYGYNETSAYIPSDLAEGTYKVTYAWTDGNGSVKPVLVPYALRKSYTAAVVGNTISFTPDDFIDVTLSDVQFTPLYVGQMYQVTAKASNTNDSEFSDVVYGLLVSDNQVVYVGDRAMLNVPANSTIDFTYMDTFEDVDAGSYVFWLATIHDGYLHGLIRSQVEVKSDSQQPSIKFGPLQLLNDDPDAVPSNDIRLQSSVTNSGGYFAGAVTAYVLAYNDKGNLISWQLVSSQPLFIENGKTVTAEFNCSLSDVYTGAYGLAQIYYNGEWVNDELWFTLYNPDEPNVTVGPLVVGNGDGTIDPAHFVASASISVANADYNTEATLVIRTQLQYTTYTFDPIEVSVAANETSEIRFSADLTGILKDNTNYTAQLYLDNIAEGDKVKFKAVQTTGISPIDADEATPTYFNLQGLPVANPGQGTYILVTPQGATKVRIR